MTNPIDPAQARDTDSSKAQTPPEPTWRPSPGAQAASRARRIGGRPLPGPKATGGSSAAGTETLSPEGYTAGDTEATSKADESKSEPMKPAKPAKPAKPTKPAKPAKLAEGTKRIKASRQRRVDAEARPKARRRHQRHLRWVPAGVAGLAVAAMLVVGAWQSHGVWWGSRLHDNRAQVQQQVLAAAKPCTAAILSYDYRNIPAAVAAGEKCVTGNLKTQYLQVMNQTVKVVAPQTKTVQTFQVAKAGIASVSPDGKQWVVVVFGQETVTNSTTPSGSPRLDLSSAVVTLNEVNGQWVVSNLTNTGNGG